MHTHMHDEERELAKRKPDPNKRRKNGRRKQAEEIKYRTQRGKGIRWGEERKKHTNAKEQLRKGQEEEAHT